MTNTEMAEALKKRRNAVLARLRLREWARARVPAADLATSGVQPALAFWSAEEGDSRLADAAVHGLASAARLSGLEVHLWTTQSFENVPGGVRVREATEILGRPEFDAAVARVGHVAVVADLLRLRAIRRSASVRPWFWDCDTLTIRDVHGVEVGEDSHGQIFASLPAAPGKPGGTRATEKRWCQDSSTRPRDGRFIASPFCPPRGNATWPEMLRNFEEVVLGEGDGGPVEYNVFMNAVAREMKAWGLEDAVLPTSAFSPIPPWTGGVCLQAKAHEAIDPQEILENSCGVNCFWQSGKKERREGARERGAAARVKPGSAWASILEALQRNIVEEEKSGARAPKRRLVEQASSETEIYEARLTWPAPLWSFPTEWPSSPNSAFSQCALRCSYELVRVLGSGSYAQVYEAQRRGADPAVAVKVSISPRPQWPVEPMELHYHEKSEGPGVVALLDAWCCPSFSVLVMEKLREDVRSMLRERPGEGVQEGTLRCIMQGAANCPRRLHEAFVMHRKLHTGNVFLGHSGMDGEHLLPEHVQDVKIAHFGKAQEVQRSTSAGRESVVTATCGARSVRPPELLFGRGTVWASGVSMPSRASASSQLAPEPPACVLQRAPRTCYCTEAVDVWALGCLLRACTGRPLHNSQDKAEMGKELVWKLGRVAKDVVERLQWPVPSAWMGGPTPEACTTELLGSRALGGNGYFLRGMRRYDQYTRARAAEVATARRTEEGGRRGARGAVEAAFGVEPGRPRSERCEAVGGAGTARHRRSLERCTEARGGVAAAGGRGAARKIIHFRRRVGRESAAWATGKDGERG
ncbi:MAG: protein kinase [bacterium]|nr:protein kinase [bacterium]